MEVLQSLKTYVGILIDAKSRQIRRVTINDGWSGMHDYDPVKNDRVGIETVFSLSESHGQREALDCFEQEFTDKGPRYNCGFVCWYDNNKFIVVGSAIIYRYLYVDEIHVSEMVFIDAEFPIENIVEGTGPIPGKMVIQWI